jgi:hypothetical protein
MGSVKKLMQVLIDEHVVGCAGVVESGLYVQES